jgi:hypothetical protein
MPCSPLGGDLPKISECHPDSRTKLYFRSDTVVGITTAQHAADTSADLLKEWNDFYPMAESALGTAPDSVKERSETTPTIMAEWARKPTSSWWALVAMGKDSTGVNYFGWLITCDTVTGGEMCGRSGFLSKK